MKPRSIIVAFALCTILLSAIPVYMAHAENYVQYEIKVNLDGSADWVITQAADLNGTVETWNVFQQKITVVVEASANLTQRQMGIDPDSLQMSTIWETQSHTTEYQFTWLNFSIIQEEQIIFGDVFRTSGFFSQLYGDGVLEVSYPSNYTVQSVSPQPNGGSSTPQTLNWLGTQFFVNGNPNIELAASSLSPSPDQNENNTGGQLIVLIGVVIAVAVAASLAGFYLNRRRRNKNVEANNAKPRVDPPVIESEEEKILKLIQAKGGSMYQSDITDQCRFSKAKTSILLTALEKKGVVTRYKKGRDKIVTLIVQGKGENS
ncbi:MAG: hypothetical protein NWF05_00580 [Candidatus Bathyarchaeota archaeon]|nr:hypothetical protein [Candidatus Bathyarchaeota archaeon]